MRPDWHQIQFLLAASGETDGLISEAALPGDRETLADLAELVAAEYLVQSDKLHWDGNNGEPVDDIIDFIITDAGRAAAQAYRDTPPPELTDRQIALLREAQTHAKQQITALWKHGGDNMRYRTACYLTRRGLLRRDAERPSRFRLTVMGRNLLRTVEGIEPEPAVPAVYFTFWWGEGAKGSPRLRTAPDAEAIEKADEYAESRFWFFYHLRIRSRRAADPVLEVGCVSASAMDAADFAQLTRKLLRHFKPDIVPVGYSSVPESLVAPVASEDYTELRPWLHLINQAETRPKRRFRSIEVAA